MITGPWHTARPTIAEILDTLQDGYRSQTMKDLKTIYASSTMDTTKERNRRTVLTRYWLQRSVLQSVREQLGVE